LDASLLVVGNFVGAGIFLVSPYVAQNVRSGTAFLATWVLGGMVALAGALSTGELGGRFPRSGGEYVYLREAYSPMLGFLSGWTSFWIGFPGSIAALAAGFGTVVAGMAGLAGPRAATAVGAASIAGLTLLNALGLRPGKWVVNTLSITKLVAFLVLLALGLAATHAVSQDAASPGVAAPAPEATIAPGGALGIAMGLVPALFAYSGWNAATYVAGEMRDPRRDLWRALALGTLLCTALYVGVNLAYLRAIPLEQLRQATDPARVTAMRLGGPSVAVLLGPLVAVCILSSLQATVLVGPHIYRAMALDGLFFKPFGRVHAKTGAPLVALLVQSAIALAELLSNRFDELVTFVMVAIIGFSMLTVAAVFVLRLRQPDAPRPFGVPGYPLVPVLFVGVNAWVLWSVLVRGATQALVGIAIVATGVPAYLVFRRRKNAGGAT
jgi:APA family basic amino acid/polyamine antiporter